MAKDLDRVIRVDNEDYNVNAVTAETADTAKKVEHTLTINTGTTTVTFDGSEDRTVTVEAGTGGGAADTAENANKILVNMDDGVKDYATITISKEEPTDDDGNTGDIWFKILE